MDNKINICHISDIHFGKFENKSLSKGGATISLIDSFTDFVFKLKEDEKPHFLIISGDLTSISSEDEYKQFIDFINRFIRKKCFAKCKFDQYCELDRTIVIPGNHDVVRKLQSGKKFGSDRLESFKNYIANKGFNTPLGVDKAFCYTEKEKQGGKTRHACPIPCSLFYYPEYNILFSTLVSCYFGHKVIAETLEIKEKVKELRKQIEGWQNNIKEKNKINRLITELEKNIDTLMFFDYGSFPGNYRRVISRAFKNFKSINKIQDEEYNNLIKFAATHHHLIDLPFPQVNTQNARETLILLYKHKVISILHGHVHRVLRERFLPDTWSEVCSSFSSGTVSGYSGKSLNSFNMIEINNFSDICKATLKIKYYEANRQGVFKERRKLYKKKIDKFLKSMRAALSC